MVDPHPGSLYTIRGAAWLPGYTPALASPRYTSIQALKKHFGFPQASDILVEHSLFSSTLSDHVDGLRLKFVEFFIYKFFLMALV